MESLLPVLAHKAAGGGLALHGGGSLAEAAGDGKNSPAWVPGLPDLGRYPAKPRAPSQEGSVHLSQEGHLF